MSSSVSLLIQLDIFHATPQSSLRLAPIDVSNRFVASVAALRETKMSRSVIASPLNGFWYIPSLKPFESGFAFLPCLRPKQNTLMRIAYLANSNCQQAPLLTLQEEGDSIYKRLTQQWITQ
jgi:hypothetical protein